MSRKLVAYLPFQKYLHIKEKILRAFSVILYHFPTWEPSETPPCSWKQVQIPQLEDKSLLWGPSLYHQSLFSRGTHPTLPPMSAPAGRLLGNGLGRVKAFLVSPRWYVYVYPIPFLPLLPLSLSELGVLRERSGNVHLLINQLMTDSGGMIMRTEERSEKNKTQPPPRMWETSARPPQHAWLRVRELNSPIAVRGKLCHVLKKKKKNLQLSGWVTWPRSQGKKWFQTPGPHASDAYSFSMWSSWGRGKSWGRRGRKADSRKQYEH